MKRRDFITKLAAAGVGAAALGANLDHAEATFRTRLPRRPFGNSGRALSIIGMGGIVVSQVEQKEADEIVAWAVERGVNYFDVAPTYGNAQERLGPALKPYRDDCFLACKTGKRDAEGARAELEQSLKLLQTDHVDLYQLHGLTKPAEVGQALGLEGAIQTFIKAKEQGLVRHIGFSAHSPEAALQAMDTYPFDSVLFPFNCVCIENGGGFGLEVFLKAAEKGVACLALKALAWTPWAKDAPHTFPKCWYQPIEDPQLQDWALRYTLDLPIVAAIPPGDARVFKPAVEIGLRYEPLTDPERHKLKRRIRGVKPIFHEGE